MSDCFSRFGIPLAIVGVTVLGIPSNDGPSDRDPCATHTVGDDSCPDVTPCLLVITGDA